MPSPTICCLLEHFLPELWGDVFFGALSPYVEQHEKRHVEIELAQVSIRNTSVLTYRMWARS